MNPLDRKLAKTLKVLLKSPTDSSKRDKAAKDFRDRRRKVMETDLGSILDRALANILSEPAKLEKTDTTNECNVIALLRERGFVELSAVLFQHWREEMGRKPLEEVLSFAPDVASLEVWRKTAQVSAKEIEGWLMSDPARAYATVGADWLLLHAKPERTMLLLEFFLRRRERPKTLPDWADALVPAMKEGKGGALLESIIRYPWPDIGCLATLGELVRFNRTLLKRTVEQLPVILCKEDAAEQGMFFVKELFGPLLDTQGEDREFLSATLARLGCGVLLECPAESAKTCMEYIRQTARQLRNVTRETDLRSRTWVLDNLCSDDLPDDARLQITIDGARQIALAMDKAQQGFDAKDILAVAARNLGLTPIGKTGEKVSFSPTRHQDIEGGMLPGDPAQVEEGGWSYQDDVIVRAKVKHTKD
jgi:hypothetical protein